MKKILVTGCTGFIGNYVVAELLRRGIDVIGTSLNETKAKTFDWYNAISYMPLNLNKIESARNYYSYFSEPDGLIHLAWEGLPNYKSLYHFEVNLPTQYAFLKNLVMHGLADITVVGTCFEYGIVEGCLHENMCTKPGNSYALGKDTLRKFLEELKGFKDYNFKWVRLFYLYGKGQNPKSLLSQLDKALEDNIPIFNMSGGEQLRDYLKVEEVAKYLVDIATQKKVQGVINCCSGKPVKIKAFVEEYLNSQKKNIDLNLGYYPYSDLEPMSFWGDTKKLKSIIDE